MDIKQAIDNLEYINWRYCTGKFDQAMRMAIGALRAKQDAEKNDPLTLDELREMDGQPVWVDDWIEPYSGWELSEDASDYFEGRDVKKYGSAWVAYRRQPKDDHL